MYPNDLAHIGKYIKRDLEENGYSYRRLREDRKALVAEHYKPNILLISGLYDKYIDLTDANMLWEAWGEPKRILYKCGHSGIVLNHSSITEDVTKFVNERISKGGHSKCSSYGYYCG